MDSVAANTIWSSTGATPYGNNLTGIWCIENQQICMCVILPTSSAHSDKYSLVRVFDNEGPGFKVHPQWTKTAAIIWQSDEQKHVWQFHIYFVDEEGFLAEARMSHSSSGLQCRLGSLKETQKIKPDLNSGIMAVIGEGRIKVFITKQDDTTITLLHSPLSVDTQWTQKVIKRGS